MVFIKKIEYYWWFIYYSAYWTAYIYGERDNPKSNACYFMNVLIFLFLFGILEFCIFFGLEVSLLLIIFLCLIPAYLIPYLIISKDFRYKKKMKQFEFLKERKYNIKRNVLLLVIALLTTSFVALGGFIRMQ